MRCAADPEAASSILREVPGEEAASAQVQNLPAEDAESSGAEIASSVREADPTLEGTRTAQLATLAEQADIR